MDVSLLSERYRVRPLGPADVGEIYALCSQNALYYQYCPPFVTQRSILDDMRALPSRKKDPSDKHYVGYYDGEELIAVLDLILAYPDARTAFIGFFMTDVSVQNRGTGSGIVADLCRCLAGMGYTGVRLGWIRGYQRAERFWRRNGFRETGLTYDTDAYTVIVAQRDL